MTFYWSYWIRLLLLMKGTKIFFSQQSYFEAFTCLAVWPGDKVTMSTDIICERYQGRTRHERTVWHGKAQFYTCQLFLSQRRGNTIYALSKLFRPFPSISKDVPMTSEHCRREPKMFWRLSNIADVREIVSNANNDAHFLDYFFRYDACARRSKISWKG